MTTPSESSVEASEAAWALQMLVSDAMEASWTDEDEYANAAIEITKTLIAAGYVAPADHERAVRQARAEGWSDALNAIAWCQANGAASMEAAYQYACEHNPHAAQPEDPSAPDLPTSAEETM